MGATSPSIDADDPVGAASEAAKPAVPAPTGSASGGQWLARLNRAVQRASIYPVGHPLVEQAVSPVVEGLARLMQSEGPLAVHVARHELLVACQATPPQPCPSPWLASRLAARGVVSLAFDRPLGREDATRLVAWLAGPPSDEAEMPAIEGLEVTWRDYARARFTERRRAGAVAHDALLVWRDAASDLAGDWWLAASGTSAADGGGTGADLEGALADPASLAQLIRRRLLANEGTGLSDVTSRLFAAGTELASLDEPVRQVVRRRLAALVAELAPELRGQLLRGAAHDRSEKLDLLVELVDELPSAMVLEMIQHLDVGPAGVSAGLVGLLTRLGGLARHHPELEDALVQTLAKAGVPADALEDGERLRETLAHLLAASATDGAVSDAYRRDLTALGRDAAASVALEEGRFVRPTCRDDLAFGAARIALTLLSRVAEGADVPVLLGRALDEAATALARGDVEYLGALAGVAIEVERHAVPEVQTLARAALTFLRRADVIDHVLEAALDPSRPTPVEIRPLMRAGGGEAAARVVDRLAACSAPTQRASLVGLLVHVEHQVLAGVLSRSRTSARLPGAALVALLGHQDMADASALAERFVDDEDPAVRLQAFRLALRNQPAAGRFERLVLRGVDDTDMRIAVLALAEAQARDAAIAARAAGHLLCQRSVESNEPAQWEAVQWLARDSTPGARRALAAALSTRRGMWRAAARRVSRRMVAALDRFADEASRSAARKWRRSPAGLVSWILADRAGGIS